MLINPYIYGSGGGGIPPAVLLQLQIDTTLVDAVGVATLSPQGSVAVSSVHAKFGTKSYLIPGLIAANINYLRTTAPGSYFVFPGEFTMEGFFYLNSFTDRFMSVFAGSRNYTEADFWTLQIRDNGLVAMARSTSSGTTIDSYIASSAGVITTGAWFHLGVSRDSSDVVRIFHNGTKVAEGTDTGTYGVVESVGTQSMFDIGRAASFLADNGDLDAYFEEICVRNSCRFTDDFTPPTAPFPT